MKRNRTSGSRQPLQLKAGNTQATIYRGRNGVGGKSYDQFTLFYKAGGKRLRKHFVTLEAARRQADFVVVKIENQYNEVLASWLMF